MTYYSDEKDIKVDQIISSEKDGSDDVRKVRKVDRKARKVASLAFSKTLRE